jgi:hypothetical protein
MRSQNVKPPPDWRGRLLLFMLCLPPAVFAALWLAAFLQAGAAGLRL